MRILSVIHAFPPEGTGGSERYAAAVGEELQRRGVKVSVFSGTLEGRVPAQTSWRVHQGMDVEVVHRGDQYFDHWDKIYNPHVSQCFAATLEREQPDLVHVHHWIRLTSDLVRRAALRGIPVVVHLHDLFVTCPRVFRIHRDDHSCFERARESVCLPCVPRWTFQGDDEIKASLQWFSRELKAEIEAASLCLAPAASHARSIEGHLDLGPDSIAVLPHPRIGGCWPAARYAASPAGRLKLLFFAQLHPIKGLHQVLAAIRRLGDPSGVEIDVFGAFATKEYETKVRGLAQGLSVRFHGAYQGSQPAAVAADVVVIPSLAQESYSFSLDEAHDLGLPILSSNRGALGSRATARMLTYAADDLGQLVDGLQRLRDDTALRERVRQAEVSQVPDVGRHVDLLLQRFEEARTIGARPVRLLPLKAEDVAFEWDRRERAFGELLRSEGWEKVIADLSQKISARDDASRDPRD